MKARRVYSNSELQNQNSQRWQVMLKAMCDNMASFIIVLHDTFGFGAARIYKFMNELRKFNKTVTQWQDEGIADEKIRERFEEIGIRYEDIYSAKRADYDDFYHNQKVRRENKDKVGYAEAVKAVTYMQTMKELMRGDTDGR